MILAMSTNIALVMMWILFTLVALAGLTAVLVWAVRSRQFSDQDRARYLPLKSRIVTDPKGLVLTHDGPAPAGPDNPPQSEPQS